MHSLHQTMNPHFFFLAPRLPHVVQGAKGTGDSGCEVHDGRRGEESSIEVQLSHGGRFFGRCTRTRTKSLSESKHFVLVKEDADVETFKAVRQITLDVLDVLLELQNEARFELAVRASERYRGRHPDPAR